MTSQPNHPFRCGLKSTSSTSLISSTELATVSWMLGEYEYVMAEFGIPPKQARNAFTMFSVNNDKKIDMEYFRNLCTEYYRSDDPSSLGNFINGKLDFTD
ncbi:hypothetical protein DPMN_066809 [Dreissena polymorpha]|uniref:EF-hand domain-containing protein n=1 Tax=Dreissena polymorpha TaxID=45954 RepID=A0A9D4BVB7_DREPO|nr:hypothetical protein DPMN_066809 [Dreissena polymorpha]